LSTRPDTSHAVTVLQLAPEPPEVDRYTQALRRRKRRRIALACALGVTLALALMVWEMRSAAAHYDRGREALADEQYYAALQELSAARILVFSYRDAEALASEAREALDEGIAQAVRRARAEAAVRRLVERADTLLTKGVAAEVERVLVEARSRVPDGPLTSDTFTLALLDTLGRRLTSAVREALADSRWGLAGTYAAALLAIDPESQAAGRLAQKAELGARLQDKVDDARAAARRGEWRRTLRLAEAVVAQWPGFPGAASLAARARTALTPEPTPTPTATATSAPPPPTPTAPSTPTPPPP
jgi:hypothetical protein